MMYFLKLTIFLIVLTSNLVRTAKWTGNFANFPNSWPIIRADKGIHREIINDPAGGNVKVLKVKYPKGSCSSACHPITGGAGIDVAPAGFNGQIATLEYSVFFANNVFKKYFIYFNLIFLN